MMSYSRLAFFCCTAFIWLVAFVYYPKWQQTRTEATLSWDVSGYYFYLPAIFIYHDLKKLSFADTLLRKYEPAPGFDQAFVHPASGHRVMKYSMGQALQLLPGFWLGHLWARMTGAAADGFSPPYQKAISWWSLCVAVFGLWGLRKVLLLYFSDKVTAATLLLLVFGTNYLNYSAIDHAMTHNWLFTCYACLLLLTVHFYEKPSRTTAAAIGLLCGWATLTRPTEIISMLLPLLWTPPRAAWHGWNNFLLERILFLKRHLKKILLAVVVAGMVLSLQLGYWKYVSGEWIVYSYGDQGFSWTRPHILDGLFSGRAGWLVYSPAMFFAVIGAFILLKKSPALSAAILPFLLIFMYVTWAWDIWWYGGSLGQRAMVQSYPVWAFALAAFFESTHRKWQKWLTAVLLLLCLAFNLWITHQAHRGGLFVPEQMTFKYLVKIVGKSKSQVPTDWLKLLDNPDYYEGAPPATAQRIFQHDFENDTTGIVLDDALAGKKSGYLDAHRQFSETWRLPAALVHAPNARWLRVSGLIFAPDKEWEFWKMTQLVVRFLDAKKKVIKERMIRLHRHLESGQSQFIHLDARVPQRQFDYIEIFLWNADGQKKLLFDNLKVEVW